MTSFQSSHSAEASSKLLVRSEVLAVIRLLLTLEEPSRQEKQKQFQRLARIENSEAVQTILLKELTRASGPEAIQVISELLMETGTIESLQTPLWALIQGETVLDEIKDAANLILRHLGDEADPDEYLDYLKDPQGLINRETERMLELSAANPEALVDFLDFIVSLPLTEQENLLISLHKDYPPEYLVNIYIPLLLFDCPDEMKSLLLKFLGETRIHQAALFLLDYQSFFEAKPSHRRLVQQGLKQFKIAGFYQEPRLTEDRQKAQEPHVITQQSTPYKCFATFPDGTGNQGLIFSRQRTNGDISICCVAISDLIGVTDCFGFYQLTPEDFQRILQKFCEESSKAEVPASYVVGKMQQAIKLNVVQNLKIPYEFTCWKVLFSDFKEDTTGLQAQTSLPSQKAASQLESSLPLSLYEYPDFRFWFLEDGDIPELNGLFSQVRADSMQLISSGARIEKFIQAMEQLAFQFSKTLFHSPWKQTLLHRLQDVSMLFQYQNLGAFSHLALQEAVFLQGAPHFESSAKGNFWREYSHRCIEEELLKLSYEVPAEAGKETFEDKLSVYLEALLQAWTIENAPKKTKLHSVSPLPLADNGTRDPSA